MAINYCKKNGLEFYAVNKNYPEEEFNDSISRKINADIYIDDKNIGGFPGWGEIWHMLDPDGISARQEQLEAYYRDSWITKIRKLFKRN